MSDQELCQCVVNELQFDPSIDSSKISVQAEKGVVTLMGRVSSYADKVAAQNAARRVRGVLS
jgi:osmotically-inducible protein OsmY